jgi:isopentenyl-diphosphate delta-isomerase
MNQTREERKYAHLDHAVAMDGGPRSAGWDDISLIHQALFRYDLGEIETRTTLFAKELAMPLVINAITGGAPGLEKINAALAKIAAKQQIGLAVGSQTSGIKNKNLRSTYEVVRKFNPEGLIIANISALAPLADALEAIDMIRADALQLHLNGIQELIMEEGDRNFRGLAENIRLIAENAPVPVMVKEVGFGISRETARELSKLGIQALDISGTGGTNFASIELARNPQKNLEYWKFWGIPTACSLLEVAQLKLPVTLMASGGITGTAEAVKALALGADVVGIAGAFLKTLVKEGEKALAARIGRMRDEFRALMLASGARDLSEVRRLPLVVLGQTKSWAEQRGIDLREYSCRHI